MPFPFNQPKNKELAKRIAAAFLQQKPQTFASAEKIKNALCGEDGVSTISNTDIMREGKDFPTVLKRVLQKRKVRTESGVAVITILTKPFACPGQCVFCPQEKAGERGETLFAQDSREAQKVPARYRRPGAPVMPKSYFSNEPAAARALLASFDPFRQIKSRLRSLELTGHDTSKIELIILGGTFSFLPRAYRTHFVKRALQALNGDLPSLRTTLAAAQKKNETAAHRCIALVVETRPDFIDAKEIRYLRLLGCTKVELGVQSTDDKVLTLCKRGHLRADSVRAIKLLRDAGFKLGFHLMPGLPGSTPVGDLQVFREIFTHPDFKPDFLKIYPCSVTPFSELAEWHREGRYLPMPETELFALLLAAKKLCPSWVRISRLVRDIPATAILGGSKTTNLRQHLLEHLRKSGECCRCIRCREVKSEEVGEGEIVFKSEEFLAADGKEFFLSLETAAEKLLALLRLRFPSSAKVIFRELAGAALIRELHTYGTVVPVGGRVQGKAQHGGLGTRLIGEAEKIAQAAGYKKIAVISGIGVKDFWRRRGYDDKGAYLVKRL